MVPYSVPWQAMRLNPHEEYLETSWRYRRQRERRCRSCVSHPVNLASGIRHGRRNDDATAAVDEPCHGSADANVTTDGDAATADADVESVDLVADGLAVSYVLVATSDEPVAHAADVTTRHDAARYDAARHTAANDAAVAHDAAAAYDAAWYATTWYDAITWHVDADAARYAAITRHAVADVRATTSILPTKMKSKHD